MHRIERWVDHQTRHSHNQRQSHPKRDCRLTAREFVQRERSAWPSFARNGQSRPGDICAQNILRLPVEIASPQGQSNRRSLARSIEIPGYVLSRHGVNTCDHVYEEPLMPALRHSPRPGDQRKHNSLISSTPAATSNGLERAMQKVIGLTISPQPTQTDAGQSTTRRFRVTQTGTGEPLNKP